MPITSGDQLLSDLLYGARTDLDWEQLHKTRGDSVVLAPRERIDLMLRAVNGDALTIEEWTRLTGAPLKLPLSVDDDVLRTARTALPRDARPALQAALEHIVRNSATAIQKAAQNVAEILNGRLYTWPELSVWNGKWKRRERVVAESIGPALVYALSLLLDPELDYGVLLRRCALESCGRFALGVPPKHRGQPPNYFCPGTDHRVQSARQKGREAVAAHRACMSVGTWRRLQARKAK